MCEITPAPKVEDCPCYNPPYPTFDLQALRDTEPLLRGDEACVALLSEALGKQTRYGGLLTDARPATVRSYIYTQKTEENGQTRHSFCYSLEADRWREVSPEPCLGGGSPLVPDLPGSHLSSFAEKVGVVTAGGLTCSDSGMYISCMCCLVKNPVQQLA